VTRIVVAERAKSDVEQLIISRELPADTHERVRRALSQLETFPLAGRRLVGRWRAYRVVIGPLPWMLLVYQFDDTTDTVTVLAVHDARSVSSATSP
jgi:mRNA-degrading endonuclease RelE of RelBE toxin-antitoxin system